MRKASVFLIATGAMFLACGGDNTANFVGIYNLTGTRTFSGGFSGSVSITGSQTITKSAIAGKIVLGGANCSPTATVTTSNSFTVDQYACPGFGVTNFTDATGASCGTCQETLSFVGGTGSLVGTTLTISANGNYTVASCTVCTGSLSGTFTDSLQGNKQ